MWSKSKRSGRDFTIRGTTSPQTDRSGIICSTTASGFKSASSPPRCCFHRATRLPPSRCRRNASASSTPARAAGASGGNSSRDQSSVSVAAITVQAAQCSSRAPIRSANAVSSGHRRPQMLHGPLDRPHHLRRSDCRFAKLVSTPRFCMVLSIEPARRRLDNRRRRIKDRFPVARQRRIDTLPIDDLLGALRRVTGRHDASIPALSVDSAPRP